MTQEYTWLSEEPIARLPPETIAKLTASQHSAVVAATGEQPRWVADALAHGAPEGERNHMAARLAGYLHAKGLPNDVIVHLLAPFAASCAPPMEPDELTRTVESVGRYTVIAQAAAIETPPTPEQIGDTFRFTWDEMGIVLTFSQIHQERDGLKAEVEIQGIWADGSRRRIHRATVNCTSTISQNTFIKRISSYRPTVGGSLMAEQIPWDEVLEQTLGLVVDLSRQGEPVIYLREAIVKPEQYTMYPMCIDGEVVIKFADGGSAKSLGALAIAMSIQQGKSILPSPFTDPRRPVNVHYGDWESNESTHKARMLALWDGAGYRNGEALPALTYQRCVQPLPDMVPQLQKTFAEHNVGYFIVDSIAPSAGSDPSAPDTALAWFRAARALKVGILAVAHIPKDNDTLFGSVMWSNMARGTWRTYPDHNEDGQLTVAVHHRKSNDTAIHEPFKYTFHFSAGSVSIGPPYGGFDA
jgi:hypothetical protein